MKTDVAVIILAAGHSNRMGECKFLLAMPHVSLAPRLSFFETIVKTYTDFGTAEIIVVTQPKHLKELQNLKVKNQFTIHFVLNNQPERERFYSLQLGIKHLVNAEYCFVQNADSPFVDTKSLDLLYQNRSKADCISPSFQGQSGHPVLLNKNTLNFLSTANSDSNLKDLLQNRSKYKVVTENALITVDIDTPADYHYYFKTTP